ncbi:winged helix-turn-helix domain-containing protein [Sandaracinobacteroides saxicola]|uniref:Winged helix-turn-helix domain-containing protein n=1 Tax=Sandaracinobacteroides saxicola TaxID=2759707 RepID=A0A7G5IHX2_9SPHN|nr:winged helix-turn-helix domain-containing protein [Sandaracinobacteroides saxicola]QMW22964.1 winged helix-turn-helix domain-containing protein [Sandaracinobacteroides saxicola]
MDGPTPIDLAAVAPFGIGRVMVRPSLLEIECEGETTAVSPRVMQVLVALAEAAGRTVTRDELSVRCWRGRIVGEDALNRIIAKLRALAVGPGRQAFEIATVKGVGYRLVGAGTEAPAAAGPVVPAGPARRRAWRWIGGAAVGAAVAGGLWIGFAREGPRGGGAAPLVPAAADMETRGLSAVFEGTPERTADGIGYLRQATAMSPRQAPIWGSLAMAHVLSLADTPVAGRAAVIARIREAAGRGLALDPREGRSLAAIVSLAPSFGQWGAKDRLLTDALKRAPPGTAPLIFQRVLFLTAVGRTGEALALVEQLNAVSPLIPWIQAARINLLAAAGRPDEAERVAAWAGTVWPRNRLIWFTRFDLAAFGGRPAAALAIAAAGGPDQTSPRELALAVATARAVQSRNPAEIEAVLGTYRALARDDQGHAERGVRAAVALGRPDEALALAAMLYGSAVPRRTHAASFPLIGFEAATERNTALLFVPPGNALSAEAGFWSLVDRIGLAAYWRRSGAPDVCRQRRNPVCDGAAPVRSGAAVTAEAR